VQSKNKKAPTQAERDHIERVKNLPCAICGGFQGASDCHEIKQGQWFTSISLCRDCHMGSRNGIHGQKIMWKLKKMDEIDALAATLAMIFDERRAA